jgi:osmotically-inducible protein OsmY
MNIPTPRFAFAGILTLAAALGGCATFEKCGSAACRDDAAITANVQAQLNQSPDLGAPYSIRAQTIDHVVYLNGLVDVGVEKRQAAAQVQQVAGVTQVVNDIAVLNQ